MKMIIKLQYTTYNNIYDLYIVQRGLLLKLKCNENETRIRKWETSIAKRSGLLLVSVADNNPIIKWQ